MTMTDSIGVTMDDTRLEALHKELAEVVNKYKDIEILIYASGEQGHMLSGNRCAACTASQIVILMLRGEIPHRGEEKRPHTNPFSNQANMN